MGSLVSTLNRVISIKRWRMAVLTASVLAVVVAPLVVAGSASAAGCTGPVVCLYKNSNFSGDSLIVYIASVPVCWEMGFLDNQVSSVMNNTFNHVVYYSDHGCGGIFWIMDGPLGYRRNLANDCWQGIPDYCGYPNDKISSFYVF